MVILFEWRRAAMDQKSRNGLPMTGEGTGLEALASPLSRNGLPMTGEDTGLEALASPLAGYLGKIRERAVSLENCPWCTSKGLTYVLRSYRINFQESITLCTNPQCLFPLVSQSLEDVLANLVLVEPVVGSKRKTVLELEREESIKPKRKCLRSSELDRLGPQSITDHFINHVECGAVDSDSNGQHAAAETDGEKVNGNHWDCPVAVSTGRDSPQDEDDVVDQESVNAVRTHGFSPAASSRSAGRLQHPSNTLTADVTEPLLSHHCGALAILEEKDDILPAKILPEALNGHCSLDSNQDFFTNENTCTSGIDSPAPEHNEQTAITGLESLAADIASRKDPDGIESEDLSSSTKAESEELLPIPNQLFWRNSNKLCWLDSMLVALVKCRSLRKSQPTETQRSPVWQLMKGYEDACAAIQTHQEPGRDGVVRVPKHVQRKANADLQSLRMSVFNLLQPKLHCKLGQCETPVFALPLLLAMDPWVEPLFELTFHWELNCSQCKTPTKERVTKTLPTFTKILPDWHPLNAAHLAPCNVCSKKDERRTMMLQRVPPVFGLHFVEGLHDNDVRNYTFTFEGKRHSVTTFIQYNVQLEHFVTWICNPDGSWLEYDDLKHPECKTHQKLPVPAEEIHIVFWEVEEGKERQPCSPCSTLAESQHSLNEVNTRPGGEDSIADEPLARTPDHSRLLTPNDTDIVCALSTPEDGSTIMDTTVTANVDTSIGSTTLLDTSEGLTHNDIVTLTLVEIRDGGLDAQMVNDNEQTQDLSVPSRCETIDSTPDSSSTVKSVEMSDAPPPHVEPPSTSNSSESDDSSSDPTFVPGARRGPGRSKPNRGKKPKTAASPHILSSESPESSKIIGNKPVRAAVAQDSSPPAATTRQVSPVSSTNSSAVANTQSLTPVPMQNRRWSFLLSKHPVHQAGKTINQIAPAPLKQIKPTPSNHSTPNPTRRMQVPGGLLPKLQLRTAESEGLPPKAAEMYDSFNIKSSRTPSLLPPITELNLNVKSKLPQPTASNHQKLPTNTTAMSGMSLPLPGARGLPDISSRSHSNQLLRVPPGLSNTEALRYKLLKKLKAKKKKLAKLNEMLGHRGGASFRADSTDLSSPNTVTSSTYDASVSDDLLSDLLSPATTASNLSPDSTDFLEMLASGQDAFEQPDSGLGAPSQAKACVNEPNSENFLDDFLSQVSQRPTEMEMEALSALDLFI